MNIFRPYHAGEPSTDARGRLTGIDRYQDVLGRSWKRFFLTGLATMVGCLPFAAGVCYAVLSRSILVLLVACVAGGAVAGPFIACLYDTILRALRDAPGSWWQNYRKALRQNARDALLPGILTCLFLGSAVFAGMLLFAWSELPPGMAMVCVYLFSCLLFLVLCTLYWPQLVLFGLSPLARLRNALLFSVKYFWRVLGAAALQLVWWVAFVLFAPFSLFVLPLVGCWLALFVALFLLYDKLDAALGIEESIAKKYPEQMPRHDGA